MSAASGGNEIIVVRAREQFAQASAPAVQSGRNRPWCAHDPCDLQEGVAFDVRGIDGQSKRLRQRFHLGLYAGIGQHVWLVGRPSQQGLQLAHSSPIGSGGVFDHQLDHTSNMAVTYAPDAPEIETPEREIMFTVSSDALDAVVGDLEAYSQAPSMTTAEYAFDEPVEESLEILPDKRGLVLAAVFLFLEIVLVVETVFVVFESANNSDFVDSVASMLLGVALFANFVAGIAAVWVADSDRRGPRNDPYEDDWNFR